MKSRNKSGPLLILGIILALLITFNPGSTQAQTTADYELLSSIETTVSMGTSLEVDEYLFNGSPLIDLNNDLTVRLYPSNNDHVDYIFIITNNNQRGWLTGPHGEAIAFFRQTDLIGTMNSLYYDFIDTGIADNQVYLDFHKVNDINNVVQNE